MGVDEATDVRAALRAAEELYAEGRLKASEAAFGALLRSEVRAEALYGLGRISYEANDLGRAQALFEQSLGVERRSPDTLYYLGRTLLARGAASKAIAYLAEALAYQPDHEPARRELASLVASAAASADTRGAESQPALAEEPEAVAAAVSGWPGAAASPSSQGADATGPPRPPKDAGALVGVVTQLAKGVGPWRGRPAAAQIWTFRLEQRDSGGAESAGIVAVELRGHEITGALENGDWVEISERPKPGQGCRPKELRNLTADDLVRSRWRWFTN
jgi:hypothetical protein